ncbi:hypothetical protein M0805_006594 [Coniferiporia weirii]|nr:hypothetical protein M0805_006594 [Coniferiporia weirii]
MARQIVSYDDLDAPLAISLQQSPARDGASLPSDTIVAAAATSRSMSSAGGTAPTTASPPAKKRRREYDMLEGTTDDAGLHPVGAVNVGVAQNPPLFHPLAPKPPVKKRGKHRRRSDMGARAALADGSFNSNNAALENSARGSAAVPVQHWDDPGTSSHGISYDEDAGGEHVGEARAEAYLEEDVWEKGDTGETDMVLGEDDDDEDESRELTHEEVWDDSALIAAWDAATEEYEAMHGKNKSWKKERVHESPLWYNVPPEKPITKNKGKVATKQDPERYSAAAHPAHQEILQGTVSDVRDSSKPLDFDTYMPSHDASLAFASPHDHPIPEATRSRLGDITTQYASMLPDQPPVPLASGSDPAAIPVLSGAGVYAVGTDEAFSRAVGAMYWCGYWTAVYHMRRAQECRTPAAEAVDDEESQAQEEKETEMLVSTQR